jgi:AraC-like DNA-binding protein
MYSHLQEFSSYNRAKNHLGIELLQARYTKHSFSPHFHESYAIGIVEAGALSNSYRHSFQNSIFTGEMMVICPGEVHTGKPVGDDGVAYRMMYVPVKTISELFQTENISDAAHIQSARGVPLDRSLIQQFVCLHKILQESAASRLEQESMLISILAQLFIPPIEDYRPNRNQRRNYGGIDITTDYLTSYFSENISLKQLSVIAHASPYHFLRIFQKQVGLSPHNFQTQLRIEQAKRLITQNISLAQVSVQVGFYDQSHFIKAFKSLVGVTPGQYLDQVR